MVAALTQNFLNSQLAAISQNPTSKPPPKGAKPSYSIADSFAIQLDPTAAAGTPAAWNSVNVTQMTAPTITIGENGAVVLTLHVTSGTVQYIDMSGVQQTASLADTDISYTVNMTLADVADPNDLAAPQQTIDQLNGFQTSDFSIQFLALEFETASMITSCDVSSPTITEGSRQYIVLLNCLNAYLCSSTNPYILGYPVQTVNPAVTNPVLPAFAPTSCEFSTTVNQTNADLSTLNYCLMTNDDAFPTDTSSGIFNTPWVTDSSSMGMLTISNEVFVNGYLTPLVLPAIESALVMPPCPPAPYPQSPDSGITNSNSGWTSTSTGWNLTLTQSNSAQGEYGVLVKLPGPDYYQLINNQVTCDVSLSNIDGNMTVSADVAISFYTKLDVQMQLFNWFDETVTQNFTLTLTFTPGNNGTFVITPAITPSPLPAPATAPQYSLDVKVGQALSSVVNSTFGINLDAAYASLGNNISDTVNNLTTAFATNIGNDMNVLGNQFVLPAGDVFYYNSLLFDTEDDMQVNIASAK